MPMQADRSGIATDGPPATGAHEPVKIDFGYWNALLIQGILDDDSALRLHDHNPLHGLGASRSRHNPYDGEGAVLATHDPVKGAECQASQA
jgi:hypothetical protein